MAVEMNKYSNVRMSPVQEIKLAKPATELYVGQILKTIVITTLSNDQVLININGQNFNAKSAHHFSPGEILDVKVIANMSETVLEVQQKNSSLSVLQNGLLQALPKQAPPTIMLQIMHYLAQSEELSPAILNQIRAILNNIPDVFELPQQLFRTISQSGVFFEHILFEWQRGKNQEKIKNDFKGQCFALLSSLPADRRVNVNRPADANAKAPSKDHLPLPGAIPQPLQKEFASNLKELSLEALTHILRDQVSQVLARITANQINHLSHANKDEYLIMLDIPIKTTNETIDIIPLMIKQHKAEPMSPAKWSISFALNLSNMGEMQATVSLNAKNIDIKINTEKSETLDKLSEYHKEMDQLLSELGLNLRDWKLQAGLENNQIDVANLRLLDIRI